MTVRSGRFLHLAHHNFPSFATTRLALAKSPIETIGLVRDVRFAPDFVCFTSRCGPPGRCPRSSGVDPKPKLATLQEKLIKIGTKVVRHGRYITFQLAEVAISRALFADKLRLIDGLRPRPAPT